jgi:hypothetical protein
MPTATKARKSNRIGTYSRFIQYLPDNLQTDIPMMAQIFSFVDSLTPSYTVDGRLRLCQGYSHHSFRNIPDHFRIHADRTQSALSLERFSLCQHLTAE